MRAIRQGARRGRHCTECPLERRAGASVCAGRMARYSTYLLMPDAPDVPGVPAGVVGSVEAPPAPVPVDEAPDEVSPPMLLPELRS